MYRRTDEREPEGLSVSDVVFLILGGACLLVLAVREWWL